MFTGALLLIFLLISPISAVRIDVATSELTNFISEINVGTPRQTLKFELDFSTRSVGIFIGSHCPQFVSCMQPSLSDTSTFLGETLSGSGQLSRKLSAIDFFEFSGINDPVYCEYQMLSFEEEVSSKGSDVAGTIGLGYSSPLSSGKVISLQVNNPSSVTKGLRAYPNWVMSLDGQAAALPEGQLEIVSPVKPNRPYWGFGCQLFVNSRKIYQLINAAVVPNENDIVIPNSARGTLLDAWFPAGYRYRISVEGRIFIQCSSNPKVADTSGLERLIVRIYPMTQRFITILPEQLRYTGSVNAKSLLVIDSEVLCPTRIRFSMDSSSNKWVFGLPLVASVESVHLDGVAHAVRFRFIPGISQRVNHPLTPSVLEPFVIPRFGPPEFIKSGTGTSQIFSIIFESGWETVGSAASQFILRSSEPNISDDGKIISFVLLKVNDGFPLRVSADQTTILEGVFHMPSSRGVIVRNQDNGQVRVEFKLQIARDVTLSSYEIHIIESSTSLTIQLNKVDMIVPLEAFDLPPPIARGDESDFSENSCTVCMEAISHGDIVQVLQCHHSFHRACISNWIGKTMRCPNCNQQVDLRNGDSAVLVRLPQNI